MLKDSFKQVLNAYISARLDIATEAAAQAKSAATDSESAAETKWDTFGLESSYLAHGQSIRVTQCEQDLYYFQALTLADDDVIKLGSVLLLTREDGWRRIILMAQRVGGGEFEYEGQAVLIVTPESPLGGSLLGKEEGEDVALKHRGTVLQGQVERIFFVES